jgi:hypothetical protein
MGGWTLLHPWLLLGLAGASLPILIHLIGRRRAPTVQFAAFDFLLAVNKRLARRERVRQILLLLMRTLAVIALALAVARPTPEQPAGAAEAVNRYLGLVIDASASMRYSLDGRSLLERAKSRAREVVTHLQPGDSVALVIAGAEVTAPFQAPSLDASAVRAAIDAIGEPAGVADIGAAIDKTLSMLGDNAAGASLVVITDLSRNSFEQLRPTSIDPPPDVRLVDAAERDSPTALGNLAVEAVSVERSGEAPSERRLRVVVRNWGGEAVERRALSLAIDGRVTQRATIQVPGFGSSEKTLTQTFDGPGVYHGTLTLEPDRGDGYGADDVVSFVTVVGPGVDVLAVDGDPRTTPYEDELFFVERALEVIPRGDPPLRLRIVTVDELREPDADLELSAFKVVLLANVDELPESLIADLRSFVDEGGGLLFAPGDRVDFERVNQLFGALLPHPLRDRHLAADPDAGTAPLGIGDLDWDHPILAGLGLPAEESLRASRTSVYFNLGVGAGMRARSVLRFDNGAPALVERAQGKGRVMLLTTTLDVDWSDLALRSAFPALMQRAVRYLAQAVDTVPGAATRAGGEVEVPAPTGARGLALISPAGVRHEVALREADQRRGRFPDLVEVGIHRAEVLREEEWGAEPRLDVSVNPSLEESDFVPVQTNQVSEALGGEANGSGIAVSLGTGTSGDPFETRGAASLLLLALAFFFVSESLLASRG